MLHRLFRTFIHSQFGDVRRRARGAVLEVAAFGLLGIAIVLLFLGVFLLLSTRMEPWLAAILLASFALFIAGVLMLVGRSLLRRQGPDPHHPAFSALQSLGLASQNNPNGSDNNAVNHDPAIAMVTSALAAGLMLGRSGKS